MQGVSIILKKKNIGQGTDQNNKENSFFVFGYYDEMEIERIQKLSDFSPSSKIHRGEDFERGNTNRLHVRLIMKDGDDDSPNGYITDHAGILKDGESRPLFSIILLNFSQRQIGDKSFDESIGRIVDAINKTDPKYEKSVLFKPYYCLGGADAAVLCRSNNYDAVFSLLYRLREDPDLLSASYMIPCITKKEENWRYWSDELNKLNKLDEKVRLSVRVQFKHTVDLKKFVTQLQIRISNDERIKQSDEFKTLMASTRSGENGLIVYEYNEVSGNSDILILPVIKACLLANVLYGKKGYLSENTEQIRYNSIRSTLRTEYLADHQSGPDKPSKSEEAFKRRELLVTEIAKKLDETLKELLGTLIPNEYAARIISGYNQMLEFYKDISDFDHNYDIRYLFDPIWNVLYDILKEAIAIKRGFGANGTEIPDVNQFARDTTEQLNEFRSYFSEVVNDLSRSERVWIETRVLSHQIIGTSQKLIFANFYLMRKMAELFDKETKNSDESDPEEKRVKHYFIVSSGGVDYASIRPYFTVLFDKEPKNKILALKIPERSLYKPESIFFVLHEFFHYYLDYSLRKERADCIVDTMAGRCAYIAADFLTEKNLKKDYIGRFSPDLSINEVKEDFDTKIAVYKANLSANIKSVLNFYIRQALVDNEVEIKKYLAYSYQVVDVLYQIILEILSSIDEKTLENMLYKDTFAGRQRIAAASAYNRVPNTIIGVYVTLWEKIKNKDNDLNSEQLPISSYESLTRAVLTQFANKACTYDNKWASISSDIRRRLIEGTDHESENLEQLLEDVVDLYKESYADMAAACWAGYTIGEYLAIVAPDQETLERSYSKQYKGRVRLFSVLNTLFFKEAICEIDSRSISEEDKWTEFQKLMFKSSGELLDEVYKERDTVSEQEQTEFENFMIGLSNDYKTYMSDRRTFAALETYLDKSWTHLKKIKKSQSANCACEVIKGMRGKNSDSKTFQPYDLLHKIAQEALKSYETKSK